MKKRLITSALPYVNNVPHLGNLIQVLSADVFARFCRQYGYETLYVCGTDEYGTATETRALQDGVTPRELCDKFHVIHRDIYKWFNIGFDHFGRTSTPEQTEIVQRIFKDVDKAGYIKEKSIDQLYCEDCGRFLADRYVHGTCPHCSYPDARGDQCEDCGKLLEPTELIDPKCGVCGKTPKIQSTNHLYLDLPAILPLLEEWMNRASVDGFWANNAVQMTKSWIRDGLKERCITRDLKWGIPVPKKGYEDKVFYVWFDAPIGYISITKCHTDKWENWWLDPEHTDLFQFIGKDNIPFHTVIFPSSLLASGENWTMLHHMSSSEYLNYEGGKFSKSKGKGIFGIDCIEIGLPSDVWRFYIYYNRPERSDYNFTWEDFQEKVNAELIGNLGNLVNRTLTFVKRFYGSKVPDGKPDPSLWKEIKEKEAAITEKLDRSNLRDAFKEIFFLSSLGNKAFQDAEPWKSVKENPAEAADLIYNLVYLVRDLSILIRPYMPETSDRIAGFLGTDDFSWKTLGRFGGIGAISEPQILFRKLENDEIAQWKTRYAGSQEERKAAVLSDSEKFSRSVDLRTARILSVERHPDADRLYVIGLDAGSGETRTIVSGLVGHYEAEELAGKTIVIVHNLKPAVIRGVESRGMLLAAEDKNKNLEVLTLADIDPGTPVGISGQNATAQKKQITIDEFFKIPLTVNNYRVTVSGSVLACGNRELKAEKISEGTVG